MRIQGLDFIRGVAVVLVLFRHTSDESVLHKIGWIGVDLFFVLSGFLIAGLVFREFQKTGQFNAKRFFIRRGIKIYPAFYFFLIISLAVNYYFHDLAYEPRIILAEVFFLQSYLPHVWTHTWSIAVEEHFYLAMALIAGWRIRKLSSSGKRFLFWLISILICTLVMRFIVCFPKRESEFAFFSTHLRMDGIIIGVICAYLIRFRQFEVTLKKYRLIFVLLMLILISPPFVFSGGSFVMNTIGLTLMNVGFGILVLYASQIKTLTIFNNNNLINAFPKLIAFIGIHSYSIYLWHLLVGQELYRFGFSGMTATCVYLISSLSIGILFSFLIEKPTLKWREKWKFAR